MDDTSPDAQVPVNQRRIGLFGGTFNPVHIGHLRSMIDIQEACSLDQLVIIPSAVPPHKSIEGVAMADDRCAMIRQAIDGVRRFTLSDVEVMRQGFSYSIDTVKQLRVQFPLPARLFFIMGLDAFLEVDTWKSYEELLSLIPVIIMNRPGKWNDRGAGSLEIVKTFLKTHISAEYEQQAASAMFTHPVLQNVYVNDVTSLDISSTRIRQLLKQEKSIRYLVPERVADFIEKKGLYR